MHCELQCTRNCNGPWVSMQAAVELLSTVLAKASLTLTVCHLHVLSASHRLSITLLRKTTIWENVSDWKSILGKCSMMSQPFDNHGIFFDVWPFPVRVMVNSFYGQLWKVRTVNERVPKSCLVQLKIWQRYKIGCIAAKNLISNPNLPHSA